jgi:hypothetical protein
MAYSDFNVKRIQEVFQVELVEQPALFSNVEPGEVSQLLRETLVENVPLAISINTEKARSELIIAPVLVAVRQLFDRKISLFSGIELTVDKDKELTGFCDFIISQSPEQLFLKSPLIVIVEAKNENIMSGLGQCMAEMIASKFYNEKAGVSLAKLYGGVTSGNLWKFVKLENNIIYVDLDDYSIKEVSKIMGILSAMIEQKV